MGSSPVTMSYPRNSWMVDSPGGKKGKGETLSHVSPLRCSRLAVRRQRKKLILLLPYMRQSIATEFVAFVSSL